MKQELWDKLMTMIEKEVDSTATMPVHPSGSLEGLCALISCAHQLVSVERDKLELEAREQEIKKVPDRF